jgi:hypothetical protein
MKSVKNSILIPLLCIASIVHGQNKPDSLLAKGNVMTQLPTIGINFGFNHLMSDVHLTKEGPSPFLQFGYQLSITQRAAKFLNITLDLYTGTVYGEKQRNQTNLNFRTTLFSQHLNLEYNFYPLLKPDAAGRQLIRPYIGVGVGAIFFRSKGDLEDVTGSEYQYWSDGLIYAEAEGTVAQSEATPLTRDFEYETELRDANLDGLRKYPQTAFSLPINAGIRFQISKNVGINAAFAYAFNFSDMLDNVSENGSGDRLGLAGNDNHLYGSIGLSIFLGTTKPSSKPEKPEPELLADNEGESITSEDSEVSPEIQAEADAETNNLSIDEIKKKPTTEIIGQASPFTLASTRKFELSEKQSEDLTSASDKTSKNSEGVAEVISNAKENSGKASNSQKKILTDLLDAQMVTLTDLKKASTNYKFKRPETIEDNEKSKLIESINLSLHQLNVVTKEARKSKTSEDVIKVAESVQKINSATVSALEKEINLQQARINEEKLQLFNDKVSLFEFAIESSELTEDDKKSLKRLQEKLSDEYDTLITTGAISDDIKQLYAAILSSNAKTEVIVSAEPNLEETKASTFQTEEKEINGNSKANVNTNQDSTSNSEVVSSQENSLITEGESAPKKTPTMAEIENFSPKKTDRFHWADLNENGWISPEEILHFIDLLFDGEAVRSVEDIQNLIDYYFDQE